MRNKQTDRIMNTIFYALREEGGERREERGGEAFKPHQRKHEIHPPDPPLAGDVLAIHLYERMG
jgi:hypothetical protein